MQREPLLPGWREETVFVLGARQPLADGNFAVGRCSQIQTVTLPGGAQQALLVANELGDLRLYAGLPGTAESVPLRFVAERTPPAGTTIGWSSTGMPGQYRYATLLPHAADDGWDLLCVYHLKGVLEFWRNRQLSPLLFDEGRPGQRLRGVPAAIDWCGDGQQHLLIGQDDGTLTRLPPDGTMAPPTFGKHGVAVVADDVPLACAGPIFPLVMDWDGDGGRDLLVGTGDGYVMLFADLSTSGAPRYARGRRLRDAAGFIHLPGPLSATVIDAGETRFLIVADGVGDAHAWPFVPITSMVTEDLAAACSNELGENYQPGRWWRRPDELGVLVGAGPEPPVQPTPGKTPVVFDQPAGELILPLPAVGQAEVHVTLVQPADVPQEPMLEARLTPDSHWTILRGGELDEDAVQTVFFKRGDLRKCALHLRQLIGWLSQEGGVPAYLSMVRVVPLSDAVVAPPPPPPVTVAGIADAPDWYLSFRVNTADEVDEHVAQHHQAGFNLLYYKLGGGCWEYPSRYPEARSVVADELGLSEVDRIFCERRVATQEMIDRVSLTVAACHRREMRCFGWTRVQNHGERLHGGGPLDRFYVDHPEYLERNLVGEPVPGKLCLAYPEVRDYQIRICEEAIDLGCDGILVETLRHLPKVMWGEPVVARFAEQYGCDMRALPPFDPRVVAAQCEVFTEFLSELRERVVAKRADAEIHVRICAPYPLMGCDPATWVRERIVDEIIISDRLRFMAPDVAGLLALCAGSECRAGVVFDRPRWGAERIPLQPYCIDRHVRQWLAAGVASVSFYETAQIIDRPEFCRAIRRINEPSALPSRVL